MSQITVRCAGCGAAVRYDPASESLRCPYCGHAEALPATQSRIREISLLEAIEEVRLPRENLAHHRVQSCQSCGAAIAYDENRLSQRCDFCGAEAVGEALLTEQPIQPQGVLPFRLTPDEAQKAFQTWLKHLWFAPSDLTKKARLEELRGVYLPLWTFDAQAQATWRAVPGYYRTRTESYYNPQTRRQETRTVQYVEWRPPVSGSVDERFDDLGVSGLKSLPQRYLSEVGGFSTATDLIDYDARYFLGWDAALPDKPLPEAWQEGQRLIREQMEALCKAQIPGDTHRDFSMQLRLSHATTKLAYVPIYILAYRYGGRPYRVVVHGRTAVVGGDRPISWWKVGALIGAILLGLYLLWRSGLLG